MRTLNHELAELLDADMPPLIDFAQLERLVTADEMSELAALGECDEHDGCRSI